MVANRELNAHEPEGRYIGWCIGVFTRPEKKEECNDDHICHSTEEDGVWGKVLGSEIDPPDDLYWNVFDPVWGGLSFSTLR